MPDPKVDDVHLSAGEAADANPEAPPAEPPPGTREPVRWALAPVELLAAAGAVTLGLGVDPLWALVGAVVFVALVIAGEIARSLVTPVRDPDLGP